MPDDSGRRDEHAADDEPPHLSTRRVTGSAASVAASDPLNFQGILTPDERVPASAGYEVAVG